MNIILKDISTKKNFDNFYFENVNKQKRVMKIINENNQCLMICSTGGMGGTHLLSSIQNYYRADKQVVEIDTGCLISDIQHNKFEIANKLLNYDCLFFNGFQMMYEKNRKVIKSFEDFLTNYFMKNGRIILKYNPIDEMEHFNQFISKYTCQQILLNKIHQKVLMNTIKEFEMRNEGFILNQRLNKYVRSLQYASYREFEGVILKLTFLVYKDKNPLSKSTILKAYNKILKK